jgi:hypothetical protein
LFEIDMSLDHENSHRVSSLPHTAPQLIRFLRPRGRPFVKPANSARTLMSFLTQPQSRLTPLI